MTIPIKYTGPTDFVHLHCHTVYSTLDGVQSPEQLFAMCADRGWPAVAITEHGSMASVPDNYFASKASGVQYIPSCEIYYNDYEPIRRDMVARGEKLSGLKQSNPDLHTRIVRNRHLTVLAKNMTGFHNLVKMTTEAYEFGFYGRLGSLPPQPAVDSQSYFRALRRMLNMGASSGSGSGIRRSSRATCPVWACAAAVQFRHFSRFHC